MSHQIPVPPEVGIGPHITVESEVEVELRRLRERVEALEAWVASVQQGASSIRPAGPAAPTAPAPTPEMVSILAPPGEEYVVMETGHPCAVTAFSTEKHDRLQERPTHIERANVDRWKDGYAAAERQIVAWLRTAPCGSPGHDPRWCQDCSVREAASDLIERGEHRPLKQEEP